MTTHCAISHERYVIELLCPPQIFAALPSLFTHINLCVPLNACFPFQCGLTALIFSKLQDNRKAWLNCVHPWLPDVQVWI